MTLLSTKDLRASLGGAEVLKGISLDVRAGELMSRLAANTTRLFADGSAEQLGSNL